jgi:hypothetical protein
VSAQYVGVPLPTRRVATVPEVDDSHSRLLDMAIGQLCSDLVELGSRIDTDEMCRLLTYLQSTKGCSHASYVCVGQEPYPKVDHALVSSALSYDPTTTDSVPASVQCLSQILSCAIRDERGHTASYEESTMVFESALRCSYSLLCNGVVMVMAT